MTQIVYRGNLDAAFFPFISEYQGRTVVVPGQDNSFSRQLQSSADLDKDIGIPQLYYCHNVMPTGNGLQSIGYDFRIPAFSGASVEAVWTIREDITSSRGYMARVTGGGLRVVTDENTGWGPEQTILYNSAGGVVGLIPIGNGITCAHVNGITYIYFAGTLCAKYNFTAQRFEQVILAGISAAIVVGVTESNGYLICYSSNSVAWSSTIDPTDFVPSLQTGAGGGNVEGIKGQITCGSPTSNGFTIFTQVNAVSVMYTGNSRYPFQFAECTGSGGVASLERVTYEADSGYNYVYSSKGFQVIQSKSAQTVFADLTDFLAGQYFEDFDEVTKVFIYTTLTNPMPKKMSLIAARYLVISYGIASLTHALVYDVVQKRFGKLKFPHVDCFEYELLTENVSDIPRKAIAFLQADGTVYLVSFAIPFLRRGVAILGKYQYVRSRKLTLQTLELENMSSADADIQILDMISYEGKGYDSQIPGTLLFKNKNLQTYGFGSTGPNPTGTNHSIYIQGTFDLNSLILSFVVNGRM